MLAVVLLLPLFYYTVVRGLEFGAVTVPNPTEVKVVRLDQGWKDVESKTREYHHLSQGTKILPFAWFMALDEPTLDPIFPRKRLASREYLSRFGFLYDPEIELNGWDIRRMTSVTDEGGLPRDGKDLIVVAEMKSKRLHIRIFDSDGKTVVDKDETMLTDKGQQLNALRTRLDSFQPDQKLTGNEKYWLIVDVASIVGYTVPKLIKLEVKPEIKEAEENNLPIGFAIENDYWRPPPIRRPPSTPRSSG